VTSLALMGLLGPAARIEAESLRFAGHDLTRLSADERRRLAGKDMAMIFQEPTTSLNPAFTIGFQLVEAIEAHEGGSRMAHRRRALELLDQVGIPDPERRMDSYPHQLSGGMNQRVMIAMALACNPRLLIADEPTTALDVTIQAQILALLLDLQRTRGMALILITHDLAVVAETADRVMVMYAGQAFETGRVADVLARPRNPYTQALLTALPERAIAQSGARVGGRRPRLPAIPGVVPGQHDRPAGCLFSTRCQHVFGRCHFERPALHPLPEAGPGAASRCHAPLDDSGRLGRER
jgi:dipeptide transport system ATP-binding protein